MTGAVNGRREAQRGRSRRRIGLLIAVAVATGSSACGSSTSGGATATAPHQGAAAHKPGAGKPPVTIGSKNFTEEIILGQLYAQALRAKGYTVTLKGDIGDSELVGRELKAHQIDGYPEYTGTVLSVLAHYSQRPGSASQAYKLAQAFERRKGDVLLAMAPAQDTDVVITTPRYAAAHHLRAIGDLAGLGSMATLAGPPEFRSRFSGLIGLKDAYRVTRLRFLPVGIGSQYTALSDGRAQLAVGFTTDGTLTRSGYVMLADPQNIFGFQNVTFIVRSDAVQREGPAFVHTINAVSAILTTQALRVMNADVTLDQQRPAAVAHQFLAANGLT